MPPLWRSPAASASCASFSVAAAVVAHGAVAAVGERTLSGGTEEKNQKDPVFLFVFSSSFADDEDDGDGDDGDESGTSFDHCPS